MGIAAYRAGCGTHLAIKITDSIKTTMNQYEVPALIAETLPGTSEALHQCGPVCNMLQAMGVLCSYTREQLQRHDVPAAIKCMKLADRLYERGDTIVRSAVENVFVYSFSGIRARCNAAEWQLLQSKMPITLYTLYIQQLYRSNI